MLDADLAYEVLNNLVENIDNNDFNLDFGVLGSKFVPNTLAEMGKIDVAYNMINTTDFPGWGHWISQGATTLWEDWQGESSRNHIFFGDVSAWFYKYLGGIRPDEQNPGYKHFIIKPYFPEDLTWVKTSTESRYGRIESNWERNGDAVSFSVRIPFNTTAKVVLPGNISYSVKSKENDEVSYDQIKEENEKIELILSAGRYNINFNYQ